MKPNNIPPSSARTSKNNPTKSRQKIWVVLVLILLLIAIGYFTLGTSNTESTLPVDDSANVTEQAQTELATDSMSEVTDESVINDGMLTDANSAEVNNGSSTIPSPTTILDAPLPKNDSLAKEEIDRLEDERQRLAEQEKLAAEQVAMNKQLTDMKAEQIALLEKQIAQLEASGTNETAVQ